MLKSKKELNRTWMAVLVLAAVLFLGVGVIMMAVNDQYLLGIEYIISSVLFLIASAMLSNKKLKIGNKKKGPFFNIGFIFVVIGLSVNVYLWVVGAILFVMGMVNNKK